MRKLALTRADESDPEILQPNLAEFFLRTVHAAQTDMLPRHPPGKLTAAGLKILR